MSGGPARRNWHANRSGSSRASRRASAIPSSSRGVSPAARGTPGRAHPRGGALVPRITSRQVRELHETRLLHEMHTVEAICLHRISTENQLLPLLEPQERLEAKQADVPDSGLTGCSTRPSSPPRVTPSLRPCTTRLATTSSASACCRSAWTGPAASRPTRSTASDEAAEDHLPRPPAAIPGPALSGHSSRSWADCL
jgi:hypothetical protein